MPPTKTEALLVPLREQLTALTDEVAGVKEVVVSLGDRIKELEVKPAPQAEAASVTTTEKPKAGVYSPNGFEGLVASVLNNHFSCRITGGPNPAFVTFTVSVPKKYSNASQAHWDMYKRDERVKIIPVNEGEARVKEYLEQVFNNFNPDQKALIVNDR